MFHLCIQRTFELKYAKDWKEVQKIHGKKLNSIFLIDFNSRLQDHVDFSHSYSILSDWLRINRMPCLIHSFDLKLINRKEDKMRNKIAVENCHVLWWKHIKQTLCCHLPVKMGVGERQKKKHHYNHLCTLHRLLLCSRSVSM